MKNKNYVAGLVNAKPINTPILGVIVFAVYFIVSLIHIGKPSGDETVFHYPNVLNFYKNGLNAIFNSDYSAANTPLPYIIIAAFCKIFGPSLFLARLITCVFSILSFQIIVRIFIKLNMPGWYALGILFYPYFFVNSFIFYVMNFGIFFMSAAFWILLLNKDNYQNNFLIGLFLSLAILCQQFYVVIPPAIILARLIFLYTYKKFNFLNLTRLVFKAGLLILPLILPFLLFIKWGGLTHPNFRVHTLSFYPSTIVAILFITGIYSVPLLIQMFKKSGVFLLVFTLIVSIVLIWFFKPSFHNKQGPGMFTGLTLHLIDLAEKISPVLSNIVMIVLTSFGILSMLNLGKTIKSVWDYYLLLSWAFLTIVYSTNTLIGERHILPLIIIFLLIMLPHIRPVLAKRYILVLSIVSTVYFLYWNFIKFGAV